MIRVFGFAVVAAIVASFISEGNETVIAIVFFGVIGAAVFGLVTGRTRLKCPFCHKRVKLGASVCHHCGRQVAEPRALGAPRTAVEDVLRQCPHCATAIYPAASVCPQCRRDVDAWRLHNGRWWMQTAPGEWVWLDQDRQEWHREEAF